VSLVPQSVWEIYQSTEGQGSGCSRWTKGGARWGPVYAELLIGGVSGEAARVDGDSKFVSIIASHEETEIAYD
jgi:hypothetical protein